MDELFQFAEFLFCHYYTITIVIIIQVLLSDGSTKVFQSNLENVQPKFTLPGHLCSPGILKTLFPPFSGNQFDFLILPHPPNN